METIGHFQCLNPKCGYELAQVVSHKKRTALTIGQADGMKILIDRGLLICPHCREEHYFWSQPLSAVRLGIAEAA
jgi:hypothetical protein